MPLAVIRMTRLTLFGFCCIASISFCSAMAMTAYEDIYLTILDVDGPEWTDKLRSRMHDKTNNTQVSTEQSWLLSTVV
jgi:hypothetical protein